MVLMNLFEGTSGDADMENRLKDKGGGEEGKGEINGEGSMDVHTVTYVNR